MATLQCRFAALLGLAAASIASGQQTWYIHASRGDDQNSGLSPSAPFRTLARWRQSFLNMETQADDVVLLSGTFREYLNINMHEPEHPQGLTFRRWELADGNPLDLPLLQPVLRGDTPVVNWARMGATDRFRAVANVGLLIQSVVWNWDTTVDSYGRNLGHLRRVNTTQAVESTPYSWFYDGVNLHVNVSPTPGTAVSPDSGQLAYVNYGPNGGLTVQNGVGCRYENLEAYLWLNEVSGTYGFSMEHSQDGTIIGCRTRDTSHHGIGFTGSTWPGNRILACEVRGLLGLVGDNSGDCFGMISNNTWIDHCKLADCTAHCYSLLMPDGTPLNPQRRIHGFRTGTTQSGRTVTNLVVDDFTVYSYYPECGPYSTPVRIEDAAEPADPANAAAYPIQFNRLRVVRGGYLNISGYNFHAAFNDCDLSFSECSLRGLETTGAIASASGLGDDNHVIFTNCRISANTDNPSGTWYPGFVFSIRSGTSIYVNNCTVEETGLRARGSTGVMVGWLNDGGFMLARDSTFSFRALRGVRRLCAYDSGVTVPQRNFAACSYGSISPGASYTDWYGPTFGLPDIRTEAGWLGNLEGDPFGSAFGGRTIAPPGRSPFFSGGAPDDEPK